MEDGPAVDDEPRHAALDAAADRGSWVIEAHWDHERFLALRPPDGRDRLCGVEIDCAGKASCMTESTPAEEPTQEQVDKAREALARPGDEEDADGTTRDVAAEPDTAGSEG